MKKVFSNTSEVIHVFAQQTQSEGRNSRSSIYFKENKIYSYGSHYLLGEFINSQTIIINDFGYSVTTSKHINELIQATSHKTQFFTSSICINSVKNQINFNLKKLSRANKPEIYISNITKLESGLVKWVEFCKLNKIKHKYRVNKSDCNYKKIVKIANSLLTLETIEKIKLKGKKDAIKQKKAEAKKLKSYLKDFNTYKISRFNCGDFDYLRLSECGEYVETSQSIRIEKNEAKMLYMAIKRKIDIKGYKIGYYKVNSINGTLKVGCHNIDITSVHNVGKQLIRPTKK